ncbi:MAG: hypothetical protein ACE5KO_04730 [Candidatus Bathyarchaeia archaeon]
MVVKQKLSVRIPKEVMREIKELERAKRIESVSAYVQQCLEDGLRSTSYASRRGIWNLRGARVGGILKSTFDIFCAHLDNPDKVSVEIGRQFNEFGKFALECDPSKKQNWEKALDELSNLTGWGDFWLKEGSVAVDSPLPSPDFVRGLLDGFLDVRVKKVSDEPLKYEI